MKQKSGMVSRKDDGGACWRRWYKTRKVHLLAISGDLPKNLCMEQLRLTVYCRYAESLLANPRIGRYVAKHHPSELQTLRTLSAEFKEVCERDRYKELCEA